jgi:hypothetical protein
MFDARIDDAEPGWGRVPVRAVHAGAGALLCAVMGWFAFVQGRDVPLLGLVDLGFHELGHMLTMWAPRLIYFAAGSCNQVAVPVGLAGYFLWLQRDAVAGGLCLAWAGTSAQNVAVYIADAPYERLPLIGGMHDWAYILGPEQLNHLGWAAPLGTAVKVFGLLMVLSGLALCCWTAVAAVRAPRPGAGLLPDEDPTGPTDMWR